MYNISSPQNEFYIPIAAMDMWNKVAYPDFNYLNFGLKNYCYKNNIIMLEPEEFIYLANDGMIAINYFTERGKKFLKNIINNVKKKNNTFVYYEIDEYKIHMINASVFPSEYIKQNIVGILSFLYSEKQLDFPDINTLAIYNDKNDGISFRRTKPGVNMINLANKSANGSGHESAAGGKKNIFLDYCTNHYIKTILINSKQEYPQNLINKLEQKIDKILKILDSSIDIINLTNKYITADKKIDFNLSRIQNFANQLHLFPG